MSDADTIKRFNALKKIAGTLNLSLTTKYDFHTGNQFRLAFKGDRSDDHAWFSNNLVKIEGLIKGVAMTKKNFDDSVWSNL